MTLKQKVEEISADLFEKGFILGKTTEKTLFENARLRIKEVTQTYQAILAEFEKMLPEDKDDYGVIPKEISYNQAIKDMKAKLEKE